MSELEDNGNRDELEKRLQRMMTTTKTFDNFQKMIKTTRSFDEEVALQQKKSAEAIGEAFRKMIDLSYKLEVAEEQKMRRLEKISEAQETARNAAGKVTKKVPLKWRRFPQAFRRNPRAVIKYFLAMLVGRVLAILLYVLAAFIPALPIPESVAGWLGKPPTFLGAAFTSMRAFVVDFNPQMLVATVSTIPTDINKLLQKIGEFFQYYGRRAAEFFVRSVRNPRLAFDDVVSFYRSHAPLFVRLARSGIGVAFSFAMIKLAMIFLLPLFGGIALTVVGIKVSIILFVVARMIADKIGEFIGKHVYKKIITVWKFIQAVRNMLTAWKSS